MHGIQRWIYLTSMVRRTISAVFLRKLLLARHRCVEAAALRPTKQASRLSGVNAFLAAEAEHARSYGTAASAAGKFCWAMLRHSDQPSSTICPSEPRISAIFPL
jgi:hypothetical protein